jgi:hypothetical protein
MGILRMTRYFKSLSPSLVEPLETRTLMAHIGLDLGFGDQGMALLANSVVAELPGGTIMTFGQGGAARLNGDGSIDSSFSDQGFVAGQFSPSRALIDGNRLILIGYQTGAPNTYILRAIQLDTGTVDTSFGTSGSLSIAVPAVTKGANLKLARPTGFIKTSDGDGDQGADQLFGEGGADRLYADDAERTDIVTSDTLHGNAGDDFLISRDSENDLLFGDGGHDSGYADADDELTSIEVVQ